jgi:hypothetical protein
VSSKLLITFHTALLSLTLAASTFDVANVRADDRLKDDAADVDIRLEQQFQSTVLPFLKSACLNCHDTKTQEAKLDLSGYHATKDVAAAYQTWDIVLQRIEAGEMPPPDSATQPTVEQRQAIVTWIKAARDAEAARHAGDPGPVQARRLSNEEYNYSIRDLTGVDIRPTSTFPVDSANEAGFDNTGESLVMSPALLKKYLDAARTVVDHMLLTPDGIAFAPHPVVTDTDRDKYCVKRIVQFYQEQPTDLSDYFFAAWQLRYQQQTDDASQQVRIERLATEHGISPRYLATVWAMLNDKNNAVGPIAWVQSRWNDLPDDPSHADPARTACEELRNDVQQFRSTLAPKFESLYIEGNHKGSQPFVLWKNRQYAANRQSFDRNALIVAPAAPDDLQKPTEDSAKPEDAAKGEEIDPVDTRRVVPSDAAERTKYEAAFERFCSVFPDAFYISERGRDYVNEAQKQDGEKGRLLSAGFHSMMGYFRDDGPLCDLILNDEQKAGLDELWLELDVIASAPMRQYVGFLWFERTDSRYMRDEQFDFARAEDKNAQSQDMIERLGKLYLDKAVALGGGTVENSAIEDYFTEINQQIRRVEHVRLAAEPLHLNAMIHLAHRAYRRELSSVEKQELSTFYQMLRERDGLTHEEAIQDVVVSILMSPHFSYRLNLPTDGVGVQPLNSFELASRLSYFLWSSLPDDELLTVAATGELTKPEVLIAQTRRMLKDDRVRALAVEFGGNWLDFRRFEEHNSVDRERFPQFTDELRTAMFEEPVRFFVDLIQHDHSVKEFLTADYTFVNRVLAAHYGIPYSSEGDEWVRVDNLAMNHRGGLLPMSVFLTKNAPGLRTSPVKRGYWVVRRLLGERIPPPPPNVPEIPQDESQLGELTLRETLARHRDHMSCAGCHNRIDSFGLVFEGFGPIGEKRDLDLAGRAVDTTATFPDGQQGNGLTDLQTYLVKHRPQEFLDHLSRKLLSYGLSRSLILSDELLLQTIQAKMSENDDRFGTLVECIVTSPQFLNRRGELAVMP